jgi:hypothetical protein
MLRLGVRLGLLTGIGVALFKLVQGRRASDFGSPSADWAPAAPSVPNPNLPKPTPEPELVKPVVLEEILEKRKGPVERTEPEVSAPPAAPVEPVVAPVVGTGESVVKKAAPVKRAAKATDTAPAPAAAQAPAPAPEPAAPVKKAPAAKKAAAPKKVPPAVQDARDLAAAKKAAPVKKAPKK